MTAHACNTTLGRQRQEDRRGEFEASLGCRVHSRSNNEALSQKQTDQRATCRDWERPGFVFLAMNGAGGGRGGGEEGRGTRRRQPQNERLSKTPLPNNQMTKQGVRSASKQASGQELQPTHPPFTPVLELLLPPPQMPSSCLPSLTPPLLPAPRDLSSVTAPR